MIDILHDELLSFGEAAKLLPAGSRPASSTWWRWCTKGIRRELGSIQ